MALSLGFCEQVRFLFPHLRHPHHRRRHHHHHQQQQHHRHSHVPPQVFGPISDLVNKSRFFPEIEYIVYVISSHRARSTVFSLRHHRHSHSSSYESNGAFIEPHVDNHSVLTGIIMLSGTGGLGLYFRGCNTAPTRTRRGV